MPELRGELSKSSTESILIVGNQDVTSGCSGDVIIGYLARPHFFISPFEACCHTFTRCYGVTNIIEMLPSETLSGRFDHVVNQLGNGPSDMQFTTRITLGPFTMSSLRTGSYICEVLDY